MWLGNWILIVYSKSFCCLIQVMLLNKMIRLCKIVLLHCNVLAISDYLFNCLRFGKMENKYLQKTTKLHIFFSFVHLLFLFLCASLSFCVYPSALCLPDKNKIEVRCVTLGAFFLLCSGEIFSKYFVIYFHWWTDSQCKLTGPRVLI